jgi:hypothetical protein
MAVIVCCGMVLALSGAGGDESSSAVVLTEAAQEGAATRVVVALKAEGIFRPSTPPGVVKPDPPKPLALKVETRLDFGERLVRVDAAGRAVRAVRKVVQAASAINGEIRPTGAVLRREVALLVADLRGGGVVVISPAGPLTRPELELVQGPGDPLTLASLLTNGPVGVGARWRLGDDAVRALTAYDVIAANTVEAVLETIDAGSAKVRLSGRVQGSVLGGEGTMTCDGSFTFDRKANRVSALTLNRVESRKAGAVEAGLDVKSTLTVTRTTIPVPAELADSVVAAVPTELSAKHQELLLVPPGRAYTLRHDRDWHTYWDDARRVVLKRLAGSSVVAQCNLAMGPNAGKGRHQDLEQFRADVRRALGQRFGAVVGEGEIEGDPAGGFRYKVGIQGREGNLGVIWYYYLVAGPEGDQLLATFTLADDRIKAFGDQDLQMIGSLRWTSAPKR